MTGPQAPPPGRPSLSLMARPDVRHVLIVDDQVSFAEALAYRLDAEPGVHAFAATTVQQARWVLAQRHVDVLLLNVDLEGGQGIEFAREAAAEHPAVRVVAVTASEAEDQILEALDAGIVGWVPKDESVQYLMAVVYGTLCGETWIPPRLLTRVIAELKATRHHRSDHDQSLAALTRREKEVLECLVSGMTRDEIADRLYLSRNTVRTHIQNSLKKLNVHSTLAAVSLARRVWSRSHEAFIADSRTTG
jgi:DNA-binding NarL/FixJ family response regulator